MKLFKKNIFFIIWFIVAVLALLMRNRTLITPIVSNPDSQIAFSTGDSVLEQTWQPQVKKIVGISVPYTSLSDFESDIRLLIYSDDYSEVLLQTSIFKEFQKDESGSLDFGFKALKLAPGERYRFQLCFDRDSSDGTLLIDSGTNYAGCSIDGQVYNEALALNVSFLKSSYLFWLFAVSFPFLSFSLLCMIVWGRRWEECVGLAVIFTVTILYAAGLFEMLSVGMVLVYILSAISLIAAIYLYQKKNLEVKDLFSPAIVVYVIFCGLILLNNHGAWFARWDEYSHWGLAVKDMFYYNSFAKHIDTSVGLVRYPPFATLIEYFFEYANGLFSHELAYDAFQMTLLSSLIIICKSAGKKPAYLIASVSVMFFVPVIFFGDVYNCIYVDPMLAVFAAYVLICYFSEELSGFNLLRILGGLFALILTKDMGVVIAGCLTMVMMADKVVHAVRHKSKIVRALIRPFLCFFFVFAVFLSWQIYMRIPVKAVETKSQMQEVYFDNSISASHINLEGILQLLRHEDGGYRFASIKKFIIVLFDEKTFMFGNLGFSYVDLSILILVVTGILSLVNFWGNKRANIVSFGIFTFLAGLCYCCVLEFMYLFAFPMGEAVQLVSHGRYFASFIGGVVIAFGFLIIDCASKNNDGEKRVNLTAAYGIIAIMLICFPVESFVNKNMDTEVVEDDTYWYHDVAEVLRSFSKKGEDTLFISNGIDRLAYIRFKNIASPVLSAYSQTNIYVSEEAYQKQVDIWQLNIEEEEEIVEHKDIVIVSEETLEEKLQHSQYVFILHPADVFRESYENLFEEPDTIDDGTFYKVQKLDGKLVLTYIGKVGVKTY